MIKRLIEPLRAYDLAYGLTDGEFTPASVVTDADVVIAEGRYLIPVIGMQLYEALAEGDYPELLDDYVAPAVSYYVREVVDAPSAPASKSGLKRARAMMLRLSDFLDENEANIPEYDPSLNILKRCRINGYNIQIR